MVGWKGSRHGSSLLSARASSLEAVPNRRFIKVYGYKTKTPEDQRLGDASHGPSPPTTPVKWPPTGGSNEEQGIYQGYAERGDMTTL
jgi:hypothetical protein